MGMNDNVDLRIRNNVRGLAPALPERGKIKIGEKGEARPASGGGTFQLPKKLDHFLVTTLERDPKTNNYCRDEEIHKKLGAKPREIPVRLVYNDISLNFQSWYGSFKGKTAWCRGDGEIAERLKDIKNAKAGREEIPCPCHLLDSDYAGTDKCKPHGKLSVVIEGAQAVGGVWTLRTTSWNTIQGILSSLTFFKSITGGRLANIPFALTLSKKTTVNPVDGSSVEIWIVGLEYRGGVEHLQAQTIKLIEADQGYYARMGLLEDQVKRQATTLLKESESELAEIADEFHPDAVVASTEPSSKEPKPPEINKEETSNASSQQAPAAKANGSAPTINVDEAF
jgi:hypothetical protein